MSTGECFARARGSEEGLAGPALAVALDQPGDGLRLVAGGLEFADQIELGCHSLWCSFRTRNGEQHLAEGGMPYPVAPLLVVSRDLTLSSTSGALPPYFCPTGSAGAFRATTSGRSRSSVLGPMPATRRKSSTDR